MPGVYNETLSGIIPGGTSWDNPVMIRAYDPANRPTIRPASGAARVINFGGNYPIPAEQQKYIIIDGFVLDGVNISDSVVKIQDGASHIKLMNSELMNAGLGNGVLVYNPTYIGNNQFINLIVHNNGNVSTAHGFYIATDNNLIQGSTVYSNAGYGIQIWDTYGGIPSNNTIIDNTFYSNGVYGIGIFNGDANEVSRNVVYGNNSGGIHVDYGAHNSIISNNIFYDNNGVNSMIGRQYRSGYYVTENKLFNNIFYGEGIYIQATTTQFINNIVTNAPFIGVYVYPYSENSTISNNIIYNNAIPHDGGNSNYINNGVNTIWTNNITNLDPLYVDSTNHNFHLQNNSPAIDTGMSIANVDLDYNSIIRPQGSGYDIGAYESITIPIVISNNVSSINSIGAVANGLIDKTGGENLSQHGFIYDTSPTFTSPVTTTLGSKSGTGSFSTSLPGLTCATIYYTKAYATNSAGTSYGDTVSFTTNPCTSSGSSSYTLVPNLNGTYFLILNNQVAKQYNIQTTSSSTTTATVSTTTYPFKRTLKLGMTGNDVKALQQYLNSQGFLVSKIGPGSPGKETTYFGYLTKKALTSFQEAHAEYILKPLGLKYGTGLFGVGTRGFVLK